ncbi:MAG: serine hydrolase, partial [Limisphaerales bacterium]
GQSYGNFLRENFFQPLGMTNTGVYRAHLGLLHEALGYSLGKHGFDRALNFDPSWEAGDGALYSTVGDLYRWNEAIFNRRVLDAASLKAAFTPVKEYEGQAAPNLSNPVWRFAVIGVTFKNRYERHDSTGFARRADSASA